MVTPYAWLFANLYDASYWYNRNLVIIANIERQFPGHDNLKEIHYYFGKHRKKSAMITHLKIQYALGLGIATSSFSTTSSEEFRREFTPL
jgi:hypothetical protein